MDKVALGRRLAEARDLAGMTQEGVGRAVGLDRTAIVLLEKGERNLKVPELVRIAGVLGRPLSFFVDEPVPAAVSRRASPGTAHDSTRALDAEVDQWASDVRTLLKLGLLSPVSRDANARVPRSHHQAESAAQKFRRGLELGDGAVADLGRACQALGLHTYAAPLGESGPDGGCVEVEFDGATLGATVINGDARSGRRRMTLAHELGHWLFGDAYDSEASGDSEQMINSFAIHFLAPRAGVTKVWDNNLAWSLRDRALAVGVEFRLSWSATISQLQNLNLLRQREAEELRRDEPVSGDYLRLGLTLTEEVKAPYVSPGFMAACLTGYTESKLTSARTLEMLRGTLEPAQLPHLPRRELTDLRRSFEDHPGLDHRD